MTSYYIISTFRIKAGYEYGIIIEEKTNMNKGSIRGMHCAGRSSRQRGSSLVTVAIFSAIILAVVVGSVSSVVFQHRMTARSLAYKQSIALAEAGAERAIIELNTGANEWTGWTSSGETRTLSDTLMAHDGSTVGTFMVNVLDATGDTPIIESTGFGRAAAGGIVRRKIRVPTKGGTVPGSFGPYGLHSTANVIANSNILNDAYDSSKGPYGTGNKGMPTTLAANGWVLLNSNCTVSHVQAGGTITKNSNVNYLSLQPNTMPTAPPPYPDAELAAAKASNSNGLMKMYKVTGQNKTLLRTGIPTNGVFNFNNLNAQRLRIEMPAGTYFLTSLQINSNCDIVPLGPVKLYMDTGGGGNAIIMNSNTSINAEGSNPLPANFQVFIKNGGVIFNSNYTMYAGLYAPNANLAIFNSNTHFYGVAVANGFTLNSNCNVHIDKSMLGSTGGSGYLAQCWTELPIGG